jgi:hypothetical protein
MFDMLVGESIMLARRVKNNGTNVKAATTRRQIWIMAIVLTGVSCVIGTYLVAQVQGQSMAGAATIAVVNALGGLVAWVFYHAISRRNDGMVVIILAALGLTPRSGQMALPLNDEVTQRAVAFFILASMSVVAALFVRRPRKEEEATGRAPLWDAELDRPSHG